MRKFKNKYRIKSYDDLTIAIQQLKEETIGLEKELVETPIVKLATSFKDKSERKETFLGMLLNGKESIGSTLMKTIFMSNKLTRKYFMAYMVAKEVIPKAVEEIKNAVDIEEKKTDK